jgi:hypothetical protein
MFFLIFLSVWLLGACPLFAQSPFLDKYQFDLGHGLRQSVELSFTNYHNLGGGSAGFRLQFRLSNSGEANLHLEVFRYVPPGIATGNLLLDHIVVVFTDAHGKVLRSVTLKTLGADGGPFRIGDSSDGFYSTDHIELGLPPSRYIVVRFYGTYV